MGVVNNLPSGSMNAELLWTNPSPSSQQAEFTVDLDLSNYSAVIIYCNRSSSTPTDSSFKGYNYNIVFKEDTMPKPMCTVGANGTRLQGRRVTAISDTGITFSRGFDPASGNNSNPACIPIYIWGIKIKGISDFQSD